MTKSDIHCQISMTLTSLHSMSIEVNEFGIGQVRNNV